MAAKKISNELLVRRWILITGVVVIAASTIYLMQVSRAATLVSKANLYTICGFDFNDGLEMNLPDTTESLKFVGKATELGVVRDGKLIRETGARPVDNYNALAVRVVSDRNNSNSYSWDFKADKMVDIQCGGLAGNEIYRTPGSPSIFMRASGNFTSKQDKNYKKTGNAQLEFSTNENGEVYLSYIKIVTVDGDLSHPLWGAGPIAKNGAKLLSSNATVDTFVTNARTVPEGTPASYNVVRAKTKYRL